MKRVRLLYMFLLISVVASSQDARHSFLPEFVVAGNRWSSNSGTLPVRINSITFDEWNVYNPQTAADMLALTGEVFMQKSQYGGGSPMIRGFAANRLLYSVDGVRMNSAIFRGGNLQNVISIDPFAVSSTEVLFGPGAVSYGSDAIGGTMVFNTLRARPVAKGVDFTGSATVRTASASSEKTGHIHFGVGLERWAFLSSLTYSSYGDLKQGTHGPDKYIMPYIVIPEYKFGGKVSDRVMMNSDERRQSPSAYSQLNIMQKVRFVPSPRWDFEYAFHFSETSHYARYDRHQRMKSGKPRYAQWDYGPQLWVMNHLRVEHSDNSLMYDSLHLNMALQRFEESRISREFNSALCENQAEKVDAWSVNIDFRKSLHSDVYMMYGIEFVQNNVHSTGVSTDVTTLEKNRMAARYPDAEWYSYGIYAQCNWAITDAVNLAAGVRYNMYQIDSDFSDVGYEIPFDNRQKSSAGSICGNIGLNWRPLPGWIFCVNYARGFRAPNVDDMGKLFDSAEGCVTVPNPALKPEYADNVEVGVEKRFAHFMKLHLSAYYTYLDDAIVRRNFIFNGSPVINYQGNECRVQALQNAAHAKVWGAQMAVNVTPAKNIYIDGNVNFQRGREELDNGETSPSRHAAPLFGRVAIGYRCGKLTAELFTAFQDECSADDMPAEERDKSEFYALDTDGKVYSPSWQTFNVRIAYNMGDNMQLNATVENITDRRYRPYGSGISAAGRNLTASLTYTL